MITIAIIDYELGNIKSIFSALEKVEATPKLTKNAQEILDADGIIIPGVGAFSHGMHKLKEHRLDCIIRDFATTNKPILGICLGMQLLLSESYEFGHTEGLGLIPGSVKKLSLMNTKVQKLPHVGWNELQLPENVSWDNTILEGINRDDNMYFVHSYIAVPKNHKNILSFSKYSDSQFCSSINIENIYGCQFHPEKSAQKGLKILSNFVKICGV